jgi:hypothetical protein
LCQSAFQKPSGAQKSVVQVSVLNFSDKVKNLGLFKGTMSLVEVGWYYWKNESNICSLQDKEPEVRSSFW